MMFEKPLRYQKFGTRIVVEGSVVRIFATVDLAGIERLRTKLDALAELLAEDQPENASSVCATGADNEA